MIEDNTLGRKSYFDIKTGAAGAVVMGAIVYYVNHEYGVDEASIAAAKQGLYSFFAGGTVMKACENLATGIKNGKIARTASLLIPSVATVGLTYLLHKAKGTPEPLNSTIPTMILGPPAFAIWGNFKRNKLEKIIEEKG